VSISFRGQLSTVFWAIIKKTLGKSPFPFAQASNFSPGDVLGTNRFEKEFERRKTMPNYEFQCQHCNKKYSVSLSLKEREEKKFKCPKCGSRKSQPVFGGFFAKTSKKS